MMITEPRLIANADQITRTKMNLFRKNHMNRNTSLHTPEEVHELYVCVHV